MNIVFLDIDGVLNDSKTEEKCGVYRGISTKLLKNLFSVVSKTNSKIVLVSSWKKYWFKEPELKGNQDEFANYLDERLASMNMSIYDKIESNFLDRGRGIRRYLFKIKKTEEEINFVILDDEMFDYREHHLSGRLIRTNFKEGGLTELKAHMAIDLMLNQQLMHLGG